MSGPINPAPFLKSLVGQQIVVKLKWGMEYKGLLKKVDNYMNLMLNNATEHIEDTNADGFKFLVIRCNNILFVRLLTAEEKEAAAAKAAAAKAAASEDEGTEEEES